MQRPTKIPPGDMSQSARVVRIASGLALIALAVTWPTSWGWLGIYPLITGLMGTKPVFKALGIGHHG